MANPLKELFGNIASEIKKKTGDSVSVKYKPVEFPAKIRSISQGIDTVEIDNLLDEINGESIGDLVIAEGYCGSSARYTLKDSGVLYISGSGEITSTPWQNVENYDAVIKKVVIDNGITNLPGQAFDGCSNLTSVTLSNTIVSIGLSAFYGCAMQSITIPASVERIYEFAFSHCDSLSIVNFVDTVGWEVRKPTGELIATLAHSDLIVSTKAAKYLTDYDNYYSRYRWIKG